MKDWPDLKLELTDDQIGYLAAADNPTDLIVRFWKDIMLPAFGDSWDSYTADDPLPVQRYAIPKHQWRIICGKANDLWDFQGAGTWMNSGPSSYEAPIYEQIPTVGGYAHRGYET